MGTFDCFNHEIKLCNDIKDNDKYNNDKYNLVFLHEMLGHGMTDAYYDEMKVYCSIDQPVIIKDDNGNIAGNSLYGQAFTEAMAQIITVTALNKQLTKERISYYDLCMVQLLMLCEDNNCSIVDYANNGVNYLTDKMKENDINDPNGIIAVASYNLYNDVIDYYK